MHSNQFSGTLPSALSALTALVNLWMCCNAFTGSIPASLSTLTGLSVFDVRANALTGTVPPEFGSLRSLRYERHTLLALGVPLANS